MNTNLISMNILVDSSGSMMSIASDMEGSLNQLVDENRELDVLVTYSIFSDEYQPIFFEVPIKKVKQFQLRPNGSTALLESACKMIDEVGARLAAKPEEERPGKVMFVIVTDGHENHSAPEYTRALLMEKIKHQTEEYNWLFLFLGANQDAIAVAESYGIRGTHALQYRSSEKGVRFSTKSLSDKLRQMEEAEASNLQGIHFNDEDREAAIDDTTKKDSPKTRKPHKRKE